MVNYIDLKLNNVPLAQTSTNTVQYFDIGIDSGTGDFELEPGFTTNLIMSLFCERRAAKYEAALPLMRRGWWGNMNHDEVGFEIGSKIWLLDQTRLTTSTVNLARTYAQDALQWLTKDGYLQEVVVNSVATIGDGGNPKITLNIDLLRKDHTSEYKYFDIWEATD